MTLTIDKFGAESRELRAIDIKKTYGDMFVISAAPVLDWENIDEEYVDRNGEIQTRTKRRSTDEVVGYEVVLYSSAGGSNITVHLPLESKVMELAEKNYNKKVRLVDPYVLFWSSSEETDRGRRVTRGIKTFATDVVLVTEKQTEDKTKEQKTTDQNKQNNK